jgi:uncharacterized iron-regulated protein
MRFVAIDPGPRGRRRAAGRRGPVGLRAVSSATRIAALAALAFVAACAGAAREAPPADGPQPGTARARGGTPVERATVEARLRDARLVLLGEVHDNGAHHRLQAELVAAAASAGARPAVVFEMLDPARQDAIDAFLAGGGRDPDALATAAAWGQSGWPDFALYRPLFRAVLDAGLPIVAAGLPRGGALAPDAPERAAGFGLDEPLPPDEQAARLDEMFEGHCELLPRETLAPMVDFQRARDARLALRLLRAAGDGGRAILVAGNGHVRDGDVPALLERAGVARDAVVNVGLLEVDADGEIDPDADRFDFVLFTAAAEREDPCERLRERLAPAS